jgi:membrane-bound lytic murein transglycosylase D
MIKTLLLIFSFSAFSWVDPDSFKSGVIELEEKVSTTKLKSSLLSGGGAISNSSVDRILKDYKKRVDTNFSIDKYFKDRVHFWFRIYTQFTSNQVVIHDKENLALVYNVVDFNDIANSDLNRYVKAKLQAKLSLEQTRKIKSDFTKLSKSFSNLSSSQKQLLDKVKKVFRVPSGKRRRKSFFIGLADNLRTQTGQRDMIERGVIRAIPYFPYLEEKIKLFNIPKELLAIPFLESSFNPNAHSKVGASGAWQFMPFISSLFMPPRNKYLDYRRNIFVSSISAFDLLRENKMILKRWDLAVTAYNSGTKHLLKAKKQFIKNKKEFNLQNYLEYYDHDHIGFASKNFYAEFLALVHVLAYREEIYPINQYEKESKRFKSDNINFFIAKCRINPNRIDNLLKKSSPNHRKLNMHFRDPKRNYKRGHILVSDIDLNKRSYHKVSDYLLKKVKSKYWFKKARVKKCGRL